MTESASGLWPAVSSSLELIGRTPMLEVTRLDTDFLVKARFLWR